MRLFAALNVPTPICEPLLRLQSGCLGAKWRPPENFHITVAFYGEVTALVMTALEEALQGVMVPPINIIVEGLGAFGGKKPFALWAGVHGASKTDEEKLHTLHRDCQQAAVRAGLIMPARKYTPHLTLAYCTGVTDGQAAQYFEQVGNYQPLAFQSEGFALYSSQLGRGPAKYQIEALYGPK